MTSYIILYYLTEILLTVSTEKNDLGDCIITIDGTPNQITSSDNVPHSEYTIEYHSNQETEDEHKSLLKSSERN